MSEDTSYFQIIKMNTCINFTINVVTRQTGTVVNFLNIVLRLRKMTELNDKSTRTCVL